jgi:hypothetical protein
MWGWCVNRHPQELNAGGIGEHLEHLDHQIHLIIGQRPPTHFFTCIHTQIVSTARQQQQHE